MTKEKFVFPSFESILYLHYIFDFWMSWGGIHIFVSIIHFLNDKQEPCLLDFLKL